MMRLHDSKACPLHSHLGYAQQPCYTLKGAGGLAACDIRSGSGKDEDIGKCTGS